jgi:coatomer protein complex subunit gamma
MNCPGEVFQIVQYKSCPVIESNQIGTAYTLVELASGSSAVTGSLSCIMKYKLRNCDPATGQPVEAEGYPDEFTV